MEWIDNVLRDVAELPDRNSPEDWPEAMLVTGAELRQIIVTHAPAEPVNARLLDVAVWPAGYCRDPNGKMSIPAGKEEDFNFGYDVGFQEAWEILNSAISAAGKSPTSQQERLLLDYKPAEPGEFEFMQKMLLSAFSSITPCVKTASEPVNARLLECISEAVSAYERYGGICTFEGEPMIYASTLIEIAEIAAEAQQAELVDERVIDRTWARFCGAFGDGPDAPYPGMIASFEIHYGPVIPRQRMAYRSCLLDRRLEQGYRPRRSCTG
jgi:hypothetical protein